jgi:hypothetical protein
MMAGLIDTAPTLAVESSPTLERKPVATPHKTPDAAWLNGPEILGHLGKER